MENTPTSALLFLFCASNHSQSWKMTACTEPGSARGFFLFKREFFLATITTCMLSRRNCCKVNETTQMIAYCHHKFCGILLMVFKKVYESLLVFKWVVNVEAILDVIYYMESNILFGHFTTKLIFPVKNMKTGYSSFTPSLYPKLRTFPPLQFNL